MACSNPEQPQQAQVAAVEPALVADNVSVPVSESPDRNAFVGNYLGMNEEEGGNYLLNVQVEKGKLMLGFRTGGTMVFGYAEKSIEEKTKGTEYLVSTEDLDDNGAITFLFKCTPEGKTTEVVATWLDDQEMKPMVLKPE